MTATPDRDEDVPATTRQAIRDGIDDAYAQVNKAAHAAVERTKDGLDQARDAMSDAYATARGKAQSAGKSAADGLDSNPMAALFGGLAIGAVLGALLPRTEREARVLGSVGEKVRAATDEAVDAAKGAGREKLAELGLSRDHARDTMKSLINGAIAAAGSAGTAALETARKAPDKKA
jgi:ElaB/YqjD/DUF883 family membrane-anchored ribosome-binding protein